MFNKAIDFMGWLAHRPDLNLIENLLAILVRRVYECFRHFTDVDALKGAIAKACDSITKEELRRIVFSMLTCLGAVMHKKGGPTKY